MTFNCPKCQKALTARDDQGGARVKCPHCGAVLQVPGRAAVQPAGAQPTARQPAAQRVCPGCGAALPATAVLCVQCGYDFRQGAVVLRPVAASKRAKRPKGNRKLLIGVGVGAGVVVVVLVLAIALWPSGEARPPAGGQPVASGVQPGSPAAPGAPAGSAPAPPTSAGAAGGAQSEGLPQTLPGGDLSVPAWAGQSKDEPFDVKAFLESRAPPANNAAPLYFAAMAELSTDMYLKETPAGWPWRQDAMPPQVKTLMESIDKADAWGRDGNTGSVPLPEIETVLAAAQPALLKLDRAQQIPQCVFVVGAHGESLVPYLWGARQFMRLMRVQLLHARLKGDYEEAEQAVRRLLRLSRDLRPGGPLVAQLVSVALDGTVVGAINDSTLAQPGMDAKRCERLLTVLTEHQSHRLSPLDEGLRMEYIRTRTLIDDIQQKRQRPEALVRVAGMLQRSDPAWEGPKPFPPELAELLSRVDWQTETAFCRSLFAACLDATRRPYPKFEESAPFVQLIAKAKEGKSIVVGLLLPGCYAAFGEEAGRQARIAGGQALIAVRRYVLAHGAPPADLETATREAGLAAVPIDPFSGQPMRYKILNGKPIVYSIGSDQKDDGGLVESFGPPIPGDMVFRVRE